MKPGRLLISGVILTGYMGLLAGCSSAPNKPEVVKGAVPRAEELKPVDKNEYVVRLAPHEQTAQKLQASQSRPISAVQEKLERLRLQRQQEWERQQTLEQQRAEHHADWKQQQAQLKAQQQRQAQQRLALQQQQQAQRVQQQRRPAASQQLAQQDVVQQEIVQPETIQQPRRVLAPPVIIDQPATHRPVARQQVARQQVARQQPVYQGGAQGGGGNDSAGMVTYGGRGVGSYSAASLTGDFAGNPRLLYFIDQMTRRYGFNKEYLYGVFSQTRDRDEVSRLWAGNSGGSTTPGGWYNYRSKFVTPDNIQRGTQFWNQHGADLQRAASQFGVDPEYIVGIMGVETRWGRILGKHRIIDALTTSAIMNERRSDFFFTELENFLLMTRSERMDPLEPKGSYAGAMGYGQFMPSSFRTFAVDFDGDGIRDLWNPVDAIGSIANYFAKHGWRYGQEVAVPAMVSSDAYENMPDGFKVKYSVGTLANNGIAPKNGNWSNTERTHLLALTTVPGGLKEPWIGYQNFYVITRYNHSNYYAMAVHQLAKAVQGNVGGGRVASR